MSKTFKTPIERAEDDVKQTMAEPRNKLILASVVNRIRQEKYPKWSRDQLLCHPSIAMLVCALVRKELAFTATLDDFQILWTYLNASKRSKLVSGISRRKHR